MTHLRSVTLDMIDRKAKHFPFNISLVRSLKEINFKSPVTFFVGENGSGKSIVLEGIAAASNLPVIGSDDIEKDKTLTPIKDFSTHLRLVWSKNPHRGFLLRAENFFSYAKKIKKMHNELREKKAEFENKYEGLAKNLSAGAMNGQINQLDRRYGIDLDSYSHGKSFLKLFQSRLVPQGLYLLDEPEASLSPKRQLFLISILSASINKIREVGFMKLEHVRLTKLFLENPARFTNKL